LAKTISKDVQKLTESVDEFLNMGAEVTGVIFEGVDTKSLSIKLTSFLAARYNGTSLYLAIDQERIERNLKIIDMRDRKDYTLARIAKILGISTTTVHSVVMNHKTVTITGDFDE